MATYKNTDVHTRTWLNLINPVTKSTLELAPNDTVELDQKIENDPYLKEVKSTSSKSKSEPKPEPKAAKSDAQSTPIPSDKPSTSPVDPSSTEKGVENA